jgi:hypothetical protein
MGQRRGTILLVAALVACAACGPAASSTAGAGSPAPATEPDAPIALVVTARGLAGVPVGSSTPRWVVPGAVAAPDGSAVFAIGDDPESGALQRIDPRTGRRADWWHAKAPGSRVGAVAPGGALVAVVWPDGVAGTRVYAWDTRRGTVAAGRDFAGDLDPEAFSRDGGRVFAARYYGDY